MGVQHGIADQAQATLEDRVVLAFGGSCGFLNVQPLGAGLGAQAVLLERRHDHDVAVFALNADRHHVGRFRVLRLQHGGLDLGALDDLAGHHVGGIQGGLAGGVAAVQHVTGIRCLQGVTSTTGPGGREQEVSVDTARAGQVDEHHFITEACPVVGAAILRGLAHVVRAALAAHAATGRHGFTGLVDQHLIGVETQVLFLALEALIALGGLAAQLHGQVEADGIARVRLKFGFALDDGVVRGADKLLLEVRLLGLVYGERRRPLFLCFRIAERDNGLRHGELPSVSEIFTNIGSSCALRSDRNYYSVWLCLQAVLCRKGSYTPPHRLRRG
ncbi:hypothetical protein D3C71_1306810 [compost metagenome]